MSYLDLSIREIHQALVEKKVTPLELTTEALRRAKENTDNAFEFINEENALKEAAALTEPEVDNLLWGIPYVCKDNFSTMNTCFRANVYNKVSLSHCIFIMFYNN